ncbi:Uncharacterized protein dnm_037640 [Desulfonema magnum]|uniref:Uncharacterized protein n=1 Tax=Desulfonema magnum TaxID=45655 RepID=A0A975BLN1_9BACT|nr:Uncharacterized protein dnm_037640 [Desulfonema magnum]
MIITNSEEGQRLHRPCKGGIFAAYKPAISPAKPNSFIINDFQTNTDYFSDSCGRQFSVRTETI